LNTKPLIIIPLLILLTQFLKGQSSFSAGSIPGININTTLREAWDLNIRIESRQIFFRDNSESEPNHDFEFDLIDYSLILSYRNNPMTRLGGGYLIRFRDNKVFHRFIQQFTVAQDLGNFRLVHRLSADETLSEDVNARYRLRYRAALEIPLNGQSVDNKEFYFRINNEYLGSLENKAFDLEMRFSPSLGYNFTDSNKLESGIYYRPDSFIHGETRHNLWVTVNWFIKIR